MRRALPRIRAPRPRPLLHRSFGLSSALHADWRDRLHKKLWGENAEAAEAAAAAAAATATATAASAITELPRPPIAHPTDYMEALDARYLPITGLAAPISEWDIPAFTTTATPLSDPVAIAGAVRRAVVEVHTLALNARSCAIAYTGPEELTSRVRVVVAADGSAVLSFPGGVEAAIVAGGAKVVAEQELEEEKEGQEEKQGQEEAQEEQEEEEKEGAGDEGWGGNEGWERMQIAEDVLFDVVRRVVQLTGRRIPDPVVSRVTTVGDLLEYFETKPKPAKLNEVLLQTELAHLPNVKVYAARVRPWDKERMVGRERPFEKAVAFRYPFETAGKA